jgi:hypothetical protein
MPHEPVNVACWVLWSLLVRPMAWLCSWPARWYLACGEVELALIFKCGDAATDPRWTRRALHAVCRRARLASGSTHR